MREEDGDGPLDGIQSPLDDNRDKRLQEWLKFSKDSDGQFGDPFYNVVYGVRPSRGELPVRW
jgi:hypothetical protein